MPGKVVMTDSEIERLQSQINSVGERMEKGFEKLEKKIEDFSQNMDKRIQEVEKKEAVCNPMTNSRIDAAWRKIDEHNNRLKTLEDVVMNLKQTNRILTWLLGIVTPVMVALLIKIVVGG